MDDCTRKPGEEKEIQEFDPDSLETAMRLRIRHTIEELVKQAYCPKTRSTRKLRFSAEGLDSDPADRVADDARPW
jgi:hypothetical protein